MTTKPTVIRITRDPIEYELGNSPFSPIFVQIGESTTQIQFELSWSLFNTDSVWISQNMRNPIGKESKRVGDHRVVYPSKLKVD